MDTLKKIKCPACGKDMEKVFVPSEGINIDICTEGCGGIFFDNREFDKFNEEHEDISLIENKIKGKSFQNVDDNTIRICPACGGQMVKNTSAAKGDIKVDDCYMCGGKFLDHGELLKIREEYKNDHERQNATMEFLYSKIGKQLSKIEQETATRKINRNLGQKIFYSIMDI